MSKFIIVGKFGATHGIRGWIKVYSFTNPITNILDFDPWWIFIGGSWLPKKIESSCPTDKYLLVKIGGCESPEAAKKYTNVEIGVLREQLPALKPGDYYWEDLIGINVVNKEGVNLGMIESIMATGANDVLVVKAARKRLIPYISDVICQVDLVEKKLLVDWDEDF